MYRFIIAGVVVTVSLVLAAYSSVGFAWLFGYIAGFIVASMASVDERQSTHNRGE